MTVPPGSTPTPLDPSVGFARADPADPAVVAADDAVPRFWQELGLPGLADVHTHFLPARMLRRVWHYFDTAAPSAGVDWPITYRWPDEQRVNHLRKMGVRAFSALAYAHKPDMAADLNRWTLDFATRTPGCVPSATFFPEPHVLDYTRQALRDGARLFKVHIQVSGFDPADPLIDDVWGLLAESGTPVVVHAGSGPASGAYTGPTWFEAVLSRHPRLVAIIAHFGAPEYREFLALAQRYDGVCLDTTMAFTPFLDRLAPFPVDLLPQVRDLGLAGKVLLGSDFPNLPYPYVDQLTALRRLDLGADWLRAVCWHNAAKLIPFIASLEPLAPTTETPT